MKIPFEIRDLQSFGAVAETRSFTEASRLLGVSQSALTRQIQKLEEKLGCQLLSRSTRSLRLTEAGSFWLESSRELLAQAELTVENFNTRFVGSGSSVRIGVCQTIGLAHLPGFFHAFRRMHPQCLVRMEQGREGELLSRVDDCSLDVAILTQPSSLNVGMEVTHSFSDEFVLIGPFDEAKTLANPLAIQDIPMVQIDSQTTSGKLILEWQAKQGFEPQVKMEFDNFDLIINSVALGLGFAIVPRRALAIYARSRRIRRYPLSKPLSRTLCAVARSEVNRPPMIQAFIDAILF